MAFEFSLPTAIVGTLLSALILSATLFYLWRVDPAQRTLLFWALAFAAQTLRMALQLSVTLGIENLWLAIDTLFAVVVLFFWLGARALEQRPPRLAAICLVLTATILWQPVATSLGLGFVVRSMPLYIGAGLVMLMTAATLFHLARANPGIGYGGLGVLVGLLGLHYFDYPFLRQVPWFVPIGFGLAGVLMLMIGIAMLIITQRRHLADLRCTAARLGEELASRRESEYRYQTLVDELDEGIVVVDREARVLSANPSAASMLGVPLERLLVEQCRKPPYRLFREDGSPLADSEYPLTKTFASAAPCASRVVRLQRADGSDIWLSINTRPLFRDDATEPYAVMAAFADVSERKRAERTLLASELRFRSIFEGATSIAVQGYDRHRRVIYWNRASERFYGYSREEAFGRTIDELVIQPEDVVRFREGFADLVAGRCTAEPGEYRARRKDGGSIAVYSTQVLISNLQGEPEVYCIDIDVSKMHELQRELEDASERFRALSESAELGMVVTDRKARFVWCNRHYLSLIDATLGEVLDGSWVAHIHPEDRQGILDEWRHAVATQSGFVAERRIVKSDGDIRWGRAHVVPIRGPEGSFRGFVVTVEDITTRKEAEAALRKSEAKFRATFDQAFQFIGLLDRRGIVIDANRAALDFAGVEAREVVGKPFQDTPWWRDPNARALLIDAIERAGRGEFVRFETRNMDAAGRLHFVDFSLKPVAGPDGEIEMLIPEGRDITPLKEAEEALRRNEEKFSRIVHYSPVALAITDVETGAIVDINRAWQEFLGYTREQVVGRTSLEFDLWVDNADRESLYRKVSATGELDRHEVRYRRADGEIVHGLISGRVFEIGGRACYLWAVTDITLRHRMEERLAALNSELEARVEARTRELGVAHEELIRAEKLAALGALVAGIAHELNTPIGNCVTVASTLHDKTIEFGELVGTGALKRSSLTAYMDSARTASDLLLRSLNQARALVASFKQVAVDQTSDQRRRFDLREVVDEVLTTLSPTIRKTPHTVRAEIPAGIVMDSFPGPLGQVVNNFVNNALLHAFEGQAPGTIRLSAHLSDRDREVTMTVSDNGIGIPEEHLRRVFDPFFTTKLGQGGSGLGLHIVYNIVTQVLGGRISVDSRIGAGTTFVLKMPLNAPGANDATTRQPDPKAARNSDDQRPDRG